MTNISQQKRQKMLDFLAKLKQDHQDDDSLRAIGEIETALNEKKYGLVWEKHTEKVDEMLEHNIPVFCEDENRKIVADENDGYNFLLEGDNLHSLKLLEKTHKGKIDVIYIDPPYNTGNKDFIYNDSYVDKTDGYSHSKWLSFMSERLEIARELLSDEGVIFISIDDNEQAQLKLLCDEVFGENNFVANIHCQLSTTQGMKVKSAQLGNIVKNAEYITVYSKNGSKNIAKQPLYDARIEYDEHYSLFLKDNGNIVPLKEIYDYRFPKDMANTKPLSLSEAFKKSAEFAEIVRTHLAEIVRTHLAEIVRIDKVTGFDLIDQLEYGKWKKIDRGDRSYLLTLNGNQKIQQLLRLKDSWGATDGYKSPEGLRKIRGDWWEGFYLDMGNVTKEGNIEFKNGKKPIRLIQQIIKMLGNKNLIALDFFAGSGTTGHAVMQLNKEDGGNRKYILCTNNENNICEEVTYQRLKNIQEELPHNLKYFKTDFISKYESDEDDETISEKMLEHIKELIELEHHLEIDDEKYIILDDEDELETIIENIKDDGKLFITSGIFLTRTHQRILDDKRVSVIDIPEYYYRSELKEVGEL